MLALPASGALALLRDARAQTRYPIACLALFAARLSPPHSSGGHSPGSRVSRYACQVE